MFNLIIKFKKFELFSEFDAYSIVRLTMLIKVYKLLLTQIEGT